MADVMTQDEQVKGCLEANYRGFRENPAKTAAKHHENGWSSHE
jgi:hypothetical protein